MCPFVATLHPGTVRIVLTRGLVIFQSQQQTTIETPRSYDAVFLLDERRLTQETLSHASPSISAFVWSTRAVGTLASHPVATILESGCPSLSLPDALCGSKSRLFVTGDRSAIIGSPEIELLPARRCRPTAFSKRRYVFKTVKANYSNGTCTTMQANCLLKSEIEKTKQKPKQPLKLFSGLILISFFPFAL